MRPDRKRRSRRFRSDIQMGMQGQLRLSSWSFSGVGTPSPVQPRAA